MSQASIAASRALAIIESNPARAAAWWRVWDALLGPETVPAAPVAAIPTGAHSVQKRRRRAAAAGTRKARKAHEGP
jgi:hypothetical protein